MQPLVHEGTNMATSRVVAMARLFQPRSYCGGDFRQRIDEGVRGSKLSSSNLRPNRLRAGIGRQDLTERSQALAGFGQVFRFLRVAESQ
jgi:hypothetical protein